MLPTNYMCHVLLYQIKYIKTKTPYLAEGRSLVHANYQNTAFRIGDP